MPSEVTLEVTLRWVTPTPDKGALGKWRASHRKHRWTQSQGRVTTSLDVELEV